MEDVSLLAAFVAGLLSFVSPCVLPLVPAYISFMTGISVDKMRGEGEGAEPGNRWEASIQGGIHSLFFVMGFSLVFIALGASATALGQTMLNHMAELAKVGGALIVIFGLHFMGVFKIGFLNLEARFNPQNKPRGVWGAFMIGLAFAFGWTPCVGPILAAILALAGGQESVSEGVMMLGVYSLGLGIPFLIAGIAINTFFAFFTRIRKHMHKIEIVSGSLLVVVGLMIFFGDFNVISIWLLEMFPSLAEFG
ncbi:MAG: cytochrome c biogenesis protein CcdA [Magnetococcales bacterium]|nr:cytochrome c biogenesis protein CcdA [Magnetococcales bacterium]